MDKMVYIVQTHETASEKADDISVFATLDKAAENYNKTLTELGEIYGDEKAEFFLITEYEVTKKEGGEVELDYEIPIGGGSVTISIFSRKI